MKILDLIVKGQWYDMEDSGEKSEEYRDITEYWIKRLAVLDDIERKRIHFLGEWHNVDLAQFKHYTHVRFHRGYTNITMTFAIKEITIGMGNPQWGAPTDREVFIIKLGERI